MTVPLIAFNFWKFLFGLHRRNEGPNKKHTQKQTKNISIIYNRYIYRYIYRYRYRYIDIDIYIWI